LLNQLIYVLRRAVRSAGNALRHLRKPPDYVVFVLDGTYPELPQPRSGWPPRVFGPKKASMHDLAGFFRRIGRDERIKGVVLHLRRLEMPASQLETLRDLIAELKSGGKRVIAWSSRYTGANYFVACAADEILLQTGGQIWPLGIHRQFYFLADALDRVGMKADILQISPYKSAADLLTRNRMSDQMREMMNWLADDAFEELVRAVARGRHMDERSSRALIDASPYTDTEALKVKAVDRLISEEDLPDYLGSGNRKAVLTPFEKAGKAIPRLAVPRPGPYVALLRIEGDIVDGRSRRVPRPLPIPFFVGLQAGDLSVVRQVRELIRNKRVKAVLMYVNSRGGSATASEAISAAVEKLAARKPVVVSMGSVAASGGYYVAAPAQRIFAQPGTMTGSIGVLWGKIVVADLLDHLQFRHESVTRGQHAGLYDPLKPFSDEERRIIREHLERSYEVFVTRVMKGRGMARDTVTEIGDGKVWSGRQAKRHGLVDELGSLQRALEKARELGGLAEDAPLREVSVERTSMLTGVRAETWVTEIIGMVRRFNATQIHYLCPLARDHSGSGSFPDQGSGW